MAENGNSRMLPIDCLLTCQGRQCHPLFKVNCSHIDQNNHSRVLHLKIGFFLSYFYLDKRYKMAGKRGKAVKRKGTSGNSQEKRRRVESGGAETTLSGDVGQVERLDLLSDGPSPQSGAGNPGMNDMVKKRGRVVDFEQLLRESLGSDLEGKSNAISQPESESASRSLTHVFEHDPPEMVRCGDDAVALHVPEAIKKKIRRHEFVNLAVLLKGGVELAELFGSNLLSINEKGQLETRPKTVSDKIVSVEKWTDAFLIFSSIYLLEYPSKTQELLKYMSIIREAATRSPWFQCRLYDEQFRLRQALRVESWGEINSDLWLRCFSSRAPFTVQPSSPQSTVSQRTPTCLDFNKGSCKWSVCRYLHVCAICASSAHGKWECPNNTQARLLPQNSQVQSQTQPFRASFRGTRSFRPYWRGAGRRPARGSLY